MFQLVLEDYTSEQVTSAFKTYISRNSEIPTPADIVSLIKRGNKPPLNQAVYVALCQKHERTSFKDGGKTWNCLTPEEENYIRDYEEFQING